MSKIEVKDIDSPSGESVLTLGGTNSNTVNVGKTTSTTNVKGGTVNLGASGTSIVIPSGATITNNGTANFGKVLQVVSTTKTDTFTSSSTSFVDITGLSASITPSSTSNKILISVNIAGNGTPAASQLFARLLRDSTPISVGDTAGSRIPTSANPAYINDASTFTNTSFTFLDSPSSTSSITYKIQGLSNNAGTFYVNRSSSDTDATNRSRGTSTITLMEIAG